MAAYKGPTSDFPYGAYKILGTSQLVLGICILIVGIVHATLTYDDRKFLLLSGSVVIWCPAFAIAAGVLGCVISKKRYWEVECMCTAYVVVSMCAALAMMILILVTIFLEFYYYDIINLEPVEIFEFMKKRLDSDQEEQGYMAMLGLIIVFAGCEFILANVSACVGCCCSPVYEPEKGQGFQVVSNQPQSVMAPSSMIMNQQQPMQFVQQPQLYQQPQTLQVMNPGSMMYAQSAIGY